MAFKWVVEIATKKMVHLYDDETSTVSHDDTQVSLSVPEGVAPGNCKVDGEAPGLVLVDGAADKAGPKWAAMRAARDAKLAACDWTQSPDSPLDGTTKTAWAVYRQALRDLPAGTVDPDAVTWPTQP